MSVTIRIQSNIRNYEAVVEDTVEFLDELATHKQSYFVIDENVWRLYSETLLQSFPIENIFIIPISEELKILDSVQQIYDKLVVLTAKRNLTLISIGGGILQDITGFAASTIYRGIKWIFVPTTLLAQADSCIG